MKQRIVAVLTGLALLALWPPLHAAEVTVFAAASLTESLNEIAAAYEARSADKIIFNFGASSTLARQIEEGAPADIFFAADEAKMDRLEGKGLILKETRKSFLSNSLVIVVAADGGAVIVSPKDLATDKVKRLALAEPNSVPAGIYAREYLEKQHLWSAVEAKVVPTENVRGALAAVEAGNVEAGIVYKTDAAISRKVKVACQIPAGDTPDIRYPAAVVRGSKQLEAAKAFLEHLATEEAGKVFERHGFVVLKPGSPP
ncbi:MAG: molybdate ABC transporter substrate-binding protein [Verrucomicrobiota bacterium]